MEYVASTTPVDKPGMRAIPCTESKTVLIVDDDPWFRDFARDLLESFGLRAFEAGSVEAGRKALRDEHVDLLITDIMMPDIPGFSMIANARQEFPALKILAVSGVTTDNGYLRSAQLLGADATLEKPFTPERLHESLQYLLSSTK
jgi:DNA-binding response OmpR family regulator